MDEPCSALDPMSTAKIEDSIEDLSEKYTIVVVTHNMQQAGAHLRPGRLLPHGELIEMDKSGRSSRTRPTTGRNSTSPGDFG